MRKTNSRVKLIKGDLVLTKDTVFKTSITVEGNIVCKNGWFNLTVRGDINAWDIDAWNINARNINAQDIICESRKKKSPKARTFARLFVTDRSKLERKEWK